MATLINRLVSLESMGYSKRELRITVDPSFPEEILLISRVKYNEEDTFVETAIPVTATELTRVLVVSRERERR